MAAARWGWYRDPTGRHELRRWDGDAWSEWVIDAGRRSFDDIDGCGGPPQGELVEVDDQPPPAKRLAGAGGDSPRPTAGSNDNLLPVPEEAWSLVAPAIVTALVAGLAAAVVIELGQRGAFPAVGGTPLDELVRQILLPVVAASAVFVALVGLGLLRIGPRAGVGARRTWRTMRTVTREEILRGLVAFLMALFARTFVIQTFAGPFAGGLRPVGPLWLFAAEALLLLAVAPVVEERLFRGVLFVGLRHRLGAVKAVLGSAAVYGVATSWSAITIPATTAGLAGLAVGAVFAWFVHIGHDLRPVVVGHFLLNFWFLAERVLAS